MEVTCRTCGTAFDWDSKQGGRPPLYCDEHKSTVTLKNQLRSARARGDEDQVARIQALLDQRSGSVQRDVDPVIAKAPRAMQAAFMAIGMHLHDDIEVAAASVGLPSEDLEALAEEARELWPELVNGNVGPLYRLLDGQAKTLALRSMLNPAETSTNANALTRIAQTVAQLHQNSSGAFSNDVVVQWIEDPDG
jgi:hypothetical protein